MRRVFHARVRNILPLRSRIAPEAIEAGRRSATLEARLRYDRERSNWSGIVTTGLPSRSGTESATRRRVAMRPPAVIGALVAALLLILAYLSVAGGSQSWTADSGRRPVAPPLAGPGLSSSGTDGGEVALADFRRRPVIAQPRYPAELYEAVLVLGLAGLLFFLREREHAPGTLGLTLLVLYPLVRAGVDVARINLGGWPTDDQLAWLAVTAPAGAALAAHTARPALAPEAQSRPVGAPSGGPRPPFFGRRSSVVCLGRDGQAPVESGTRCRTPGGRCRCGARCQASGPRPPLAGPIWRRFYLGW
jgi:hypothetical protein